MLNGSASSTSATTGIEKYHPPSAPEMGAQRAIVAQPFCHGVVPQGGKVAHLTQGVMIISRGCKNGASFLFSHRFVGS